VERILDAATQLVVREGVDAMTTQAIARTAGVPVASLYQYFGDKEDVLIALAGRDMKLMDDEVASSLLELGTENLTLAAIVRTTFEAFVRTYDQRLSFVEIYLRGRTNTVLHQYGREHNERIAVTLLQYAVDLGLAGPDLTPARALLAVEMADRVFQLAYEHEDQGNQMLIEEGIALVSGYLEKFELPRTSA
jgi:AcrR family transcriptional regulator